MQNGNSPAVVARADIGMRLVVDVDSYALAGRIMDEVGHAVRNVLREQQARAEFDFTHFNTHPCKTAQMAEAAYQDDPPIGDAEYPGHPARSFELTQH